MSVLFYRNYYNYVITVIIIIIIIICVIDTVASMQAQALSIYHLPVSKSKRTVKSYYIYYFQIRYYNVFAYRSEGVENCVYAS